MAAASCRENAQLNLTSTKNFNVMVANCLDDFNNQSADLVLCNPPFHQNNTITDHIAWQMFCDAQRVLRPQGELIIIGNRQLKYHEKLNRIFDKVDTVGHNDKFVVLRAIK